MCSRIEEAEFENKNELSTKSHEETVEGLSLVRAIKLGSYLKTAPCQPYSRDKR
jgi:hypothetical protein